MSMAPRLDMRQSQSLVMTPQLRQAIKLLQSSNLEVAAFVEEELERNPLLERDERILAGPDDGHRVDPLPAAAASPDSHSAAMSDCCRGECRAARCRLEQCLRRRRRLRIALWPRRPRRFRR